MFDDRDLCAKDGSVVGINALSEGCIAGRPREKAFKKCSKYCTQAPLQLLVVCKSSDRACVMAEYLRLNPMLGESIQMDSTNPKEIGYLRQCTESFLAEPVTQRELREMILILDPEGKGVGRPQLHDAAVAGRRDDSYVGEAEDDDDYRVGAEVEVFSKSAECWFDGSITKIDRKGKIVAVEYTNTLQGSSGAIMAKSLEFGSPDIKLTDKPKPSARSSVPLRRSFREPEPEPEPEDEGWSDRKVSMLEDDQDLRRQGSRPVIDLPTSVDISKHEMGAFSKLVFLTKVLARFGPF